MAKFPANPPCPAAAPRAPEPSVEPAGKKLHLANPHREPREKPARESPQGHGAVPPQEPRTGTGSGSHPPALTAAAGLGSLWLSTVPARLGSVRSGSALSPTGLGSLRFSAVPGTSRAVQTPALPPAPPGAARPRRGPCQTRSGSAGAERSAPSARQRLWRPRAEIQPRCYRGPAPVQPAPLLHCVC